MSIALRASASSTSYSTATFTVAYPAGIQAGDLLVILVSGSGTIGSFSGFSGGAASGLTAVQSGVVRLSLYWKRAVGTETGTVAASGFTGSGVAFMTAYSGVISSSLPYHAVSAGNAASGTAVTTGTGFLTTTPSDDGRFYRLSGSSHGTAQASAVVVGNSGYSNVTGYTNVSFGATGGGTPARSVIGWSGYYTAQSAAVQGTLALSTSTGWAALSIDLIEQPALSMRQGVTYDAFDGSFLPYWITQGGQVANNLVDVPGRGEARIKVDSTQPQGLWPGYQSGGRVFTGASIQFRMRAGKLHDNPSAMQVGVASYDGGTVYAQLGGALNGVNQLSFWADGAQQGSTVLVNPTIGVWVRISDGGGGGGVTMSFSLDGQFWFTAVNSYLYSQLDPRNAVPFAQVIPNGATSTQAQGSSFYFGWFNAAGSDNTRAYARWNQHPNPCCTTDTASWTATGAAIARDTTWPTSGTSLAVTPNAAGTDSYASISGDTGAIRLSMVGGHTYTAQGTVQVPVALSGSSSARALGITVQYKAPSTGAGYIEVKSPPVTLSSGSTGFAVASVTFTLPSDVTEAFVRYYNGYGNAATNLVRWTGCIIEESPVAGSYFDGDYPGCRWASSSRGSSWSYCYAQRTNFALNPGAEYGTYDWAAGGGVPGVLTSSTDVGGDTGSKALKYVWGAGGSLPGINKTNSFPTIPGRRYGIRLRDYVTNNAYPRMTPVVAGLGFLSTWPGFPNPPRAGVLNQWVSYQGYFVATDGVHSLSMWPSSTPVGGEITYLDSVHIEEIGPLSQGPDLLTGDDAPALWAGEPGYSESLLPYNMHLLQQAPDTGIAAGTALGTASDLGTDQVSGAALATSLDQGKGVPSGNTHATSASDQSGVLAVGQASASALDKGTGLPVGNSVASSGSDLAVFLAANQVLLSPQTDVATSGPGAASASPTITAADSVAGSALTAFVANSANQVSATAATSNADLGIGLPDSAGHALSDSSTGSSAIAGQAASSGTSLGQAISAAQILTTCQTLLTNAVLGQAHNAQADTEATYVFGNIGLTGLVTSGFQGYANGVITVTGLAVPANFLTGQALASSGALARNALSGSVSLQAALQGNGLHQGTIVTQQLNQAVAQALKTISLTQANLVRALADNTVITLGDTPARSVVAGLVSGLAGVLGVAQVAGLAQSGSLTLALMAAKGQILLQHASQAIDFAHGDVVSLGLVAAVHGEFLVWDGTSLMPVNFLGLWNGADVEPVDFLGVWDGHQIIDQGLIPPV